MNIEIEREKLERMLMLLAVATFHTPALQDERTELVEAGLKDLAAPVQEPVGALILGGVIDTSDGPEYEEWDVEWNTKAVEALQEKLVTSDSVTVMLYTAPPAARRQRVVFPTMLRKMWSGGEVQAWLDETVNKENT
jgi:hypothetical protein